MTQKVFDKVKKYIPYYKRINIFLYNEEIGMLDFSRMIDFGENWICIEHRTRKDMMKNTYSRMTIHRKDIRYICIYTDFFQKIRTRSKNIY